MKRKCNCPCHTNPNFMHCFPCCDNGFVIEQPRPYKQTKKSFDKFLEECRLLAQNIALPLKPHVDCPICGKPANLDKEPNHHVVEGHVYMGTYYYYWCHECKEGFTTTESDGLTLATYQLIDPPNNNA